MFSEAADRRLAGWVPVADDEASNGTLLSASSEFVTAGDRLSDQLPAEEMRTKERFRYKSRGD